MRTIASIGVGLMLALGCGGVADLKRDVNPKPRQEARTQVVEACTRAGPEGASREACTCVADEVLATHTTEELLKFAADPTAQEIAPVVKACVRKLAR